MSLMTIIFMSDVSILSDESYDYLTIIFVSDVSILSDESYDYHLHV